MKPRTAKRLTLAAIIAAVFAVALVLRRPSAPKYEITDLGPLSRFGYVNAFNNKGQIAGETEDPNGQRRAFIWDPADGRTLIRAPDRRSSTAYDINDKGQVVGELFFTGGKRSAFIWDKETGLTELDGLDGDSSAATAINNSGQVTGWIEDSAGKIRAFFWDKANGMQDLGTLSRAESIPRDINDKGQVLGELFTRGKGCSAFIWDQDNGMVDLDALWRMPSARAHAINNSGQVVAAGARNGRRCGFIWQKTEGIKEIELTGQLSSPMKINDSGQVLGYCKTTKFPSLRKDESYYLWDPEHGLIKLAISSFKGSFEARDINDKGQIIGTQNKQGPDHLIILTPKTKSEPTKR